MRIKQCCQLCIFDYQKFDYLPIVYWSCSKSLKKCQHVSLMNPKIKIKVGKTDKQACQAKGEVEKRPIWAQTHPCDFQESFFAIWFLLLWKSETKDAFTSCLASDDGLGGLEDGMFLIQCFQLDQIFSKDLWVLLDERFWWSVLSSIILNLFAKCLWSFLINYID